MIISKFKDYYDYLGQIYGIDQSFAYKRELYDNNYSNYQEINRSELNIPQCIPNYSKPKYPDRTIEVCHLLIVGRMFLFYNIVPKGGYFTYKFNTLNYKLYTGESEISEKLGIKNKLTTKKKIKFYYHSQNHIYQEDVDGSKIHNSVLRINILYKTPIIIAYNGVYKCKLALASPILGDIDKFVSIYPAEKIYTDIEYFFLNQVNSSPDVDPPVQISEKNRIESKGFDIKRSFRPKMK